MRQNCCAPQRAGRAKTALWRAEKTHRARLRARWPTYSSPPIHTYAAGELTFVQVVELFDQIFQFQYRTKII